MQLRGAGSGERYHPAHCRAPVAGFTLVEVIVVIAILGLVLGISGVALASLKAPREPERIRELRRARAEAIRTGRSVVIGRDHVPRTAQVLFLPDGRAIGSGVDPLTGAPTRRGP